MSSYPTFQDAVIAAREEKRKPPTRAEHQQQKLQANGNSRRRAGEAEEVGVVHVGATRLDPSVRVADDIDHMRNILVLDLNNLQKDPRDALLILRQIRRQRPKSTQCADAEKLLSTNVICALLRKGGLYLRGDLPQNWIRVLGEILDDDRVESAVSTAEIFHDYNRQTKRMKVEHRLDSENSASRPSNFSIPARNETIMCLFLGCKKVFANYRARTDHMIHAHLPVVFRCGKCTRFSRFEDKIKAAHKVSKSNNAACSGDLHPEWCKKLDFTDYPMLLKRPPVADPLCKEVDGALTKVGL